MKQMMKSFSLLFLLWGFVHLNASAQIPGISPAAQMYINLLNQSARQRQEYENNKTHQGYYIDQTNAGTVVAPPTSGNSSGSSSGSSDVRTTHKTPKACKHCAVRGVCTVCGGRGVCIPYIGAGERKCNICGGTGRCRVCNGTGQDGYSLDFY